MNSVWPIVFCAVSIAGCATQQVDIERRTDLEICSSYGIYRTGILSTLAPPYMDEIKRRGLLTDDELDIVSLKRIKVGISQCALYASWGKPDRENRTVYSGGVRTQHIFNSGYKYIQRTYVYTVNGKVTAWQD